MIKIDCNKEMKKFHSTEVNLSNEQQGEMRSRRNAGRTRLYNGLTKSSHPHPYLISSQGSYAMRTMVQDEENDYDIDDGLYFESEDLVNKQGVELSPKAARERVKKALDDGRLTYVAEVKRNCVRQYYPAGYHIDMPVYRTVRTESFWGNEVITYELASGDKWVKSDARAVTKWFNDEVKQEINSGDADYSQLRRVVRLVKKFARSRKSWKAKTTSGICISKLVVDHFISSDGRDDESLYLTMKAVCAALFFGTVIQHPVLDKNLAGYGDEKVSFFLKCLEDNLEHLEVLESEDCTLERALKAWGKVFNTDYFNDFIPAKKQESRSLLQSAATGSGGLTFPNKPITPNKSSGFA